MYIYVKPFYYFYLVFFKIKVCYELKENILSSQEKQKEIQTHTWIIKNHKTFTNNLNFTSLFSVWNIMSLTGLI